MEMIFEQLIKRQNEQTALVERELIFCRVIRMRNILNEACRYIVSCTEEKGIFVCEKNKLSKFKMLNRSKSVIGEFSSKKEAEEKLVEYGNTKFEYNEDEGMWTIKRGNIEAVLSETKFGRAIIEHSYPALPEEEEDEYE